MQTIKEELKTEMINIEEELKTSDETIQILSLGYIIQEIQKLQPETDIVVNTSELFQFGAVVSTFDKEDNHLYAPVKTVMIHKMEGTPYPLMIFSPYVHPITKESESLKEVKASDVFTVVFHDGTKDIPNEI